MSVATAWKRIPLALKLLVIGVVAITALILLKPRPAPKPITEEPVPLVNVVIAQPQVMSMDVITQGTVAPRRQIDLVSQVSGQITHVSQNFLTGGLFAANETLVQIEQRDYQYALTQAAARVTDAERSLATERGLARQAKREWRDLGNADANELFLRKPQIDAAEAQLAAAKAAQDQARLNLERTAIKAPFAGRIQQTSVDLGQVIAQGVPIANIYDASVAEVRLPLTDLQALLINLPLGISGQSAELPRVVLHGVIAGERYEWQGVITRTEASLDPQSRMYHSLVEIKDPFNTSVHKAPLLVGMYVQAVIAGKPIDNVIRLPKTVVFRRDQIYTVNGEQKIVLKQVRVLKTDDESVWLQGDLVQGEYVVFDRQSYLSPGVKVNPKLPEEKIEPVEAAAEGAL